MWILVFALVAVLLALVIALRLVSPGEPAPFLDSAGNKLEGSISEKIYVDVNGSRQGMFIKSKNAENPVLLYVHGGMPDYFLTRQHPTGWEDIFTVVWWEQRGSGISYDPDSPVGTITMEQLISDVLAVTDYLRRRFRKDRIYLMGHSGGTFIGIQAAARAPERYHAYIGVAQMSHQAESEVLAYEHMLRQFRESGDARMVKKLEAAPVTVEGGAPREYLAVRDEAMHELGIGTMHEMRSLLTGLVIPSFLFREYTLTEKVNLWYGKSRSGVSSVWDEMVKIDLRETAREIGTPVYLLHGVHDYTVSYALARSYFDVMSAPIKGFYTFESSAHSPMFEEPERMSRILREDVLSGRKSLADGG